MSPKKQLHSILPHRYLSEDDEPYQIELFKGMTNEEIEAFKTLLPNNHLPEHIKALLLYSKGFSFSPLQEVQFTTFGHFGFQELFPRSIQLAGDGCGNFWVLDIDTKGNWNAVYYVCHDPPVVVKQSESLSEFIYQIDEYGLYGIESSLSVICDQTAFEIWEGQHEAIDIKPKKHYSIGSLKADLSNQYVIADLRNAPIKSGFSWARVGPQTKIIRLNDDPIWIIEKKMKQGFLTRLFSKK